MDARQVRIAAAAVTFALGAITGHLATTRVDAQSVWAQEYDAHGDVVPPIPIGNEGRVWFRTIGGKEYVQRYAQIKFIDLDGELFRPCILSDEVASLDELWTELRDRERAAPKKGAKK